MKVTVVHSAPDRRPASKVRAGHSSAEVNSMLLPEAVRRAVRRHGAALVTAHGAGDRYLGHRVRRGLAGLRSILVEFLAVCGRLIAQTVRVFLGAAHLGANFGSALIQPAADRFEQSKFPSRRRLRRRSPFGWPRLILSERDRGHQRQPAKSQTRRRNAATNVADLCRRIAHGDQIEPAADGWPALLAPAPRGLGRSRSCRNAMAKLRRRIADQNKYSAATMPMMRTAAPTETQNPSRSSRITRACGP
jgi:hypothetical protein